ncbi:MAG TPA: DRTGG domain-containing protein [Verrucomicrobiae bacterium]|jgi:predicted transcriptional regulator
MKLKSATKLPALLTCVEARPLTDLAEVELSGCYISDLLSDVLANAQPGVLWVTIHVHRNVVSVASMKDITAVLFTCGRKPEPNIIAEAADKGIMLLSTTLTTYETAGKLWKAGLR